MAKTQAKTQAKTPTRTQAKTQVKTQVKTRRSGRRVGAGTVGDDLIALIDSVSAEVKSKGLSRVSVEMEGVSLQVANKLEYVTAGSALASQSGVVTRIAASPAAAPAATADAAPDIHLEDVVSPVTGTFYAAPAPGEPPFVKVSDRVKNGDVLCIVEAMKTMNKITSHHDGTVHSIEVENGEVIQTGQVLVRIKP